MIFNFLQNINSKTRDVSNTVVLLCREILKSLIMIKSFYISIRLFNYHYRDFQYILVVYAVKSCSCTILYCYFSY